MTPFTAALLVIAAAPNWKQAKSVADSIAAKWNAPSAADARTTFNALEGAIPECLAHAKACSPYGFDGRAPAAHKAWVETLVSHLGEVGGPEHLAPLLKLSAGGVAVASLAVEKIVTRGWVTRMATVPTCGYAPPTAEHIEKTSNELTDFVVIDSERGTLNARVPTKDERADLAYFLASISPADTAFGVSDDVSNWTDGEAGEDRKAQQLWKAWTAAEATGDDTALITASRTLLEHHGYPGRMTAKADQFTWGGAPFSTAMRGLAEALERRGDFAEAAHLYRRANPGGGACGTSSFANWDDQVEGLIRTAESSGRCQDVVAERMLNLKPPYDASVLVARGFDLRRLYRGALVTRNRESRPLLDGALGRLPEPLRGRAQRRLVREGNEAWATRVNAIEGLIGLLRADELPTVVRGLSVFHESGSLRSALLAVSSRAAHSNFDPCAPSATEFPPSSLSWSSVRPLNTDCTTRLTADEEDELALALVALPLPMSQSITGALVTALGSIGSPKAQGRFETFRCDDPRLCEWLAGETAKASKSISAARRHGPRVRATQ